MIKWLKKNSIIIFIGLLFLLMFFIMHHFSEELGSYYYFSYIFLASSIAMLSSLLPDWIILKQLRIVLSLPAVLVLLTAPLVKAFTIIVLGFSFAYAFSALLFIIIPIHVLKVEMTDPFKLYLLMISSFITITLFSERIMSVINKLFHYAESEEKKSSLMELSTTMMNNSRIRFFIYSFFFIYLLIFSYKVLMGNSGADKNDYAILYSFITFIAFERVVANNKKLLNFNPKLFLKKYVNVWNTDDFLGKRKIKYKNEKEDNIE